MQSLHVRAVQVEGTRLDASMKQGEPAIITWRGHQAGEGKAQSRKTVQVPGEVPGQFQSCRDQPVPGQLADLLKQTFVQTLNDNIEPMLMLLYLQGRHGR